ncbi:MAG: chalcone isomerase family protein [Acidiferrobacterales bacterium]|nr:chalcone isomerase family protein [Acidiferrobacterales bacterium]
MSNITSTIAEYFKPVRTLSLLIFAVLVGFGSTGAVWAEEVFPESVELAGGTLVKQGVGTRKKAFLSLYLAGLYLESKSNDSVAIINADNPMAIRLQIVSKLISAKRMKSAMLDGFNQSTGGAVAPIQEEIDQFATGFSDEIKKKDVFDLIYVPGNGVEVIKNGTSKVIVPGLEFKQALFGIWLSEDPIQASLKKSMLGEK